MPKDFQISQYDEPICVDGYLDVSVCDTEAAATRRSPCGSRSSGSTWRRTPASRCTSAAPPAGSTAPTTRWSTTTAPASRWSRSSPSPVLGTGALAPEVARAYVTELRDLLRSLGVSDVRMEQGSLRCDVNVSLAPNGSERARAPAPRPRTSTRCGRSSGRCGTRSTARPPCCAPAARSCRRPATSTRTPAAPPPVGRRRRPRTTATSRSPTWCRSRPSAEWVEELRATLPELPSVRRAPPAAGVGDHRQRHAVDAQRRRDRPGRADRRARRRPGRRSQVVDR